MLCVPVWVLQTVITEFQAQKNRPLGGSSVFGAGNETRTRDPDLGKVVLYQLSYSRKSDAVMASPRGLEPLLPP